MSANHLLVWNARGLNSRARRSVVRDIVVQQRASVVCLQESKVENFSVTIARLADWWQQTRADVPGSLRRVSWILWKERNRRTFDNIAKSPAQVFSLICEEADSWTVSGYWSLVALFAAVN